MTTEPRPQGICIQNFVKIDLAVMLADDRQTDGLITILRTRTGADYWSFQIRRVEPKQYADTPVCSYNLDLERMTLMCELCTKVEFPDQCFQKLEPEQDRQTQSDATKCITTPYSRMVESWRRLMPVWKWQILGHSFKVTLNLISVTKVKNFKGVLLILGT